MNIYDAAKKAIENDCFITTESEMGFIKIKPTDGKGLCIIIAGDGSNPSRHGWQPSASDLIRTDWIVTK